ncbi:flippase-like domain-containing protein [Salinibacter ruber]|uniref:flippase-like domain-containing protein n=1 Tax=Salinibacter ruber TaxID=146919 RepID=UPI002166E168|nr:uncharacterized membrane protein YbhN (UPF0104 family) [Salinibacter ruber]
MLDQLWFLVAIPLLVLATFAIDLLPSAAGAVGGWSLLAYFGGLLLWAGLYAYATLVRPRLLVAVADWCVRWPYLRRFRETVMPEMRAYFRRARHLGSRPPAFYASGFALTALTWLARYALVYLIVRSVHAADGTLLFARSAAMMLVGLIMPTPGGSGGLGPLRPLHRPADAGGAPGPDPPDLARAGLLPLHRARGLPLPPPTAPATSRRAPPH